MPDGDRSLSQRGVLQRACKTYCKIVDSELNIACVRNQEQVPHGGKTASTIYLCAVELCPITLVPMSRRLGTSPSLSGVPKTRDIGTRVIG